MTTDSILKLIADFWQVGWRPMLEILVLWIGMYQFYRLLRGTRGWAVVLGLTGFFILFLGLVFMANVFELQVLSAVLQYLLFLMPFVALVIFQPELRRILAEVGNQPLFNTARQERENIEVLVRAMERLSKMRIGALVAVEQAIQLREAVESGVELDCDASPEMLETVFFPNNAIHDGGVLIKGDRITYAACIFPLTQRHDLDRTVGTRHRAAVGLSEETDAVVIVVSEETGQISYAYKGSLERGVTLNELRQFLSSIFVTLERPGSIGEWFAQLRRRKALRRAMRRSREERRKERNSGGGTEDNAPARVAASRERPTPAKARVVKVDTP